MTITSDQVRQFLDVYVVSNTPFYLYKQLRLLDAVQRLSREADTESLLGQYDRVANMDAPAPEDVATAYACLVALTFKPPHEAIPAMRSLRVDHLCWAASLVEIYLASVRPSQSITLTPPPVTPVTGVWPAADSAAGSVCTPIPEPTVW